MYIYVFQYVSVGSKNSVAPVHFTQSPRPMPRRKKCPRMNKESPNCQETSPRTILSSASQDHKKEKRHAVKDSLPGHPKKKGLTQWVDQGSMMVSKRLLLTPTLNFYISNRHKRNNQSI